LRFDAPRPRPGYGAASPHIGCATPMRSRWPGGVPLNVIQRQLGHANLGVTSIYLQGIDSGEIIETVRSRRAPVIPAAAALAG
jgi:integrase